MVHAVLQAVTFKLFSQHFKSAELLDNYTHMSKYKKMPLGEKPYKLYNNSWIRPLFNWVGDLE